MENNLPDETAKIFADLQQKYTAEFGTLRVRDHALKILQVADIEPLLGGKDPFKDISSFPFWVKLWEAALVLADVVVAAPHQPGQRLLELGAGLGGPGLAAAAAGYRVTLSDYEPHILDFQRVSAAANGLDIECRLIDWKNPPVLAPFEYLVGAEILFREEFFEPLLQLFEKLLAPGGTIYLAHDVRRKSLPAFLRLAEPQYEIGFSTRKLSGEDGELTIIVNRLRRRS